MTNTAESPSRAFIGLRQLCAGPLSEVALAVKAALEKDATAQALVFDDRSGRVVDLDLRGSPDEILARLQSPSPQAAPSAETPPKRRGRPKLGVVSREVTLLPRHWEWLSIQRGGASATLRRLVDAARRDSEEADRGREAREAAYGFMSAIAGDLPGFEEASRALFAADRAGVERHMASWPADISAFVVARAFESEAVDR